MTASFLHSVHPTSSTAHLFAITGSQKSSELMEKKDGEIPSEEDADSDSDSESEPCFYSD